MAVPASEINSSWFSTVPAPPFGLNTMVYSFVVHSAFSSRDSLSVSPGLKSTLPSSFVAQPANVQPSSANPQSGTVKSSVVATSGISPVASSVPGSKEKFRNSFQTA